VVGGVGNAAAGRVRDWWQRGRDGDENDGHRSGCDDRVVSESTGPAEPTTTPPKPRDGADPMETGPKATKPAKVKRPQTPEQLERRGAVIRFTVFVVVGALLTVLLYFALSALIPRWWSQAVARQVGGRISAGVVIGLLYGFVFTFLPLIVLAQARHRAFRWPARGLALPC